MPVSGLESYARGRIGKRAAIPGRSFIHIYADESTTEHLTVRGLGGRMMSNSEELFHSEIEITMALHGESNAVFVIDTLEMLEGDLPVRANNW